MTADWAVMDYASRNKDHLLFNIWKMGNNSIERGSEDYWTVKPHEIYAAEEEVQRGDHDDYVRLLENPEERDPRGFIVPSDQRDFLRATKFVNALLKTGIDVERATADFTVNGKSYPAGSYVVKTAQAFRPHVLDMFEAQDHPNDFAYPGGPPIPPYDATGWTLAWQMGVDFDRILDGFDGPFQKVTEDLVTPPPGKIAGASDARGYLVDHINDAFTAVNRTLKAGDKAWWYTEPVQAGGVSFPSGAFYLETDRATVEKLAADKGLSFVGVGSKPAGPAMELQPVKVGLADVYGGSMPSGWMRMLLEDFEFDFDVLYPPQLDNGDLSKYDVLFFEDGLIPGSDDEGGRYRRGGPVDPSTIPAEYRDRLGRITVEKTVPRILDYARRGGTVIALGSSSNLALEADLPITDHLVKENGQPLSREEYFIPGTLIDMKVEHISPLADGMGDYAPVMFARSPTFTLEPDAAEKGVRAIGWYDSDHPLRSGWAWGQAYLEDGVGAIEADYGQGKLFLFGPKLTFRSQPHGMFPLVFNGIYYGPAKGKPIM
jgi:hypothetical protein